MPLAPSAFEDQALEALACHGLLTVEQLGRLIADPPGAGVLRRRLNTLARHGVVEAVEAGASRTKTWLLTPDGIDAMRPVIAVEPMRTSRRMAHASTRKHLYAINEVGIAAVRVAGSGQVEWAHEEHLPIGSSRSIRPDAILGVTVVEERIVRTAEWFIELDRGTEPVSRLAAKFINYLTYYQYAPPPTRQHQDPEPHWHRRFRIWPKIMFVFDCANHERRIRALAAMIEGDHRLANHLAKLPAIAAPLENLADAMADPHGFTRLPTLERTGWM